MVNKANPPIACWSKALADGRGMFAPKYINPVRIKPAAARRIAAKRKGGRSLTPMRMAKKVVPQRMQITASAMYASQAFLEENVGVMTQI